MTLTVGETLVLNPGSVADMRGSRSTLSCAILDTEAGEATLIPLGPQRA
jgi:predicted phosphodiesterase